MSSYAAVDKDGSEWVYVDKPTKYLVKWMPNSDEHTSAVQLPMGSIKKLTGIDLTWESDEPIELHY